MIPIEVVIETDFNPKQEDFVYSEAPNTLLLGGYGSGKTVGLVYRALQQASLNPGREGALIAPDFRRLNRDVLPSFFRLLNESHIEFKFNKTKGDIILGSPGYWGSIVHLISMDSPDKLKGATLAWLCGDEAAGWPETMPGFPGTTWEVMISRMRDPLGTRQISLVSTPEGLDNWLTKQFVTGPNKADQRLAWEESHRLIRCDTRENFHLPASYVQAMADSFDAVQFREKIQGIPSSSTGGRAYYSFDRTKHVKITPFIEGLPLIVGMDQNVTPMSATFIQISPTIPHVRVFHEISIGDSNTAEMCRAIVSHAARYGISQSEITVFPDASGRARSTVGTSDFDIIKKMGLRLRAPKKNPAQRERLNIVNGLLAHDRISIDPSCTHLTTDLSEVKTRPGTGELDKRNAKLTHASDSLGYALHWHFPIRRASIGVVSI